MVKKAEVKKEVVKKEPVKKGCNCIEDAKQLKEDLGSCAGDITRMIKDIDRMDNLLQRLAGRMGINE
tara:strand:+ start:414 stop:614 length:201 start_codon:yes stop_codon:yes gene_type:complete